MTKKSRKRSKKDNAGCMWGLISLLDFRHGQSTQKLLPEKKHRSGRQGGTVLSRSRLELLSNLEEKQKDVNAVVDSREVGGVGKASIKILMEEEMSKEHTSTKFSSSKVEHKNLEKNQKQTSENCKLGLDQHSIRDHVSSVSCQFSCPSPSENSSCHGNLAELLVEYQKKHLDCKHKINRLDDRDPHLAEKHFVVEKALDDLTKAFLTQNSIVTKQLTSNGAVRQSEELMDALDRLSSNKELFLNLLQDPDSFLVKRIQDLQKSRSAKYSDRNEVLKEIPTSGQHQEPVTCDHRQNGHHFFRKKDKSKGTKTSNESDISQDLNRIVILKPRPTINSAFSSPGTSLQHQEDAERATSHFSLKEIKRRLRHVIGESRKEQNLISMDGILHKIPYGYRNSDDTSQPSSFANRKDKKSISKECQSQKKVNKTTLNHSLHRESVFHDEAKKHLADILNTDEEDEILPPRQVPKTLGRILSLPGYNLFSPRLSPGRDKEPVSPQQVRYSPLWQFRREKNAKKESPSRQSTDSSLCTNSNPDDEQQAFNSKQCFPETDLHVGEESIANGIMGTEECEPLDRLSNKEGSSMLSELEPSEEPEPVTPSVLRKLEPPESITDKRDRPSPVSVLEPFFSGDVSSPERMTTEHAEMRAEPQQLHFEDHENSSGVSTQINSEGNIRTSWMEEKEAKIEYLETPLEDKLPDQLLDLSLFDEIKISYGPLIDDPRLLLDCIGEVSAEIQERHFSCSPWISLIKPNIQPIRLEEHFIQEVSKKIDWHLHLQLPCTLHHVVSNDLDGRTWMDLGVEIESSVLEIGEVMLEYLMEETILELWD